MMDVQAAIDARLAIYRAKRDQAAADPRPLEQQLNYTREDMFGHTVEALEILAQRVGSSCPSISGDVRMNDLREKVRAELYEALCWFGTLPEPEGDVPERYHRWNHLGQIADRILALPEMEALRLERVKYLNRENLDG